jgi:hypothetical protein
MKLNVSPDDTAPVVVLNTLTFATVDVGIVESCAMIAPLETLVTVQAGGPENMLPAKLTSQTPEEMLPTEEIHEPLCVTTVDVPEHVITACSTLCPAEFDSTFLRTSKHGGWQLLVKRHDSYVNVALPISPGSIGQNKRLSNRPANRLLMIKFKGMRAR